MSTELRVPRDRLSAELLASVARAENLLKIPGSTAADSLALLDAFRSWDEYNKRLLDRSFTPVPWHQASPKSDYVTIKDIEYLHLDMLQPEQFPSLVRLIEEKIRRIQSLNESLNLYEETRDAKAAPALPKNDVSASPQSLFLVHGRDDAARLDVQRFLEKVTELKIVVLVERPNQGQTIIEKLEGHVENSAFAVILMTADDEGRLRGTESMSYRARQNVILEMGMLIAKLGRRNVVVLYEDGVEMPSDYYGVVYIPFDSGGGWRLKVVGELKSAGVDADANKMFD